MTKIDIFSGFLGAGKTTLIKKLLADGYNSEKLVLIENEFGEIGIDGAFLQEAGINITEMNSGCICCSLVGDFGKALKKVLKDFSPDRILIEPSGVGKLSDVIKAVEGVGDTSLILNSATAVVDAKKCKMYMKNFGEFFNNQVETAKCIVLSHTDGLSEEKLHECIHLLKEKNKDAVIVSTPCDKLESAQIISAIEGASSLYHDLKDLEDNHCPICNHHHEHNTVHESTHDEAHHCHHEHGHHDCCDHHHADEHCNHNHEGHHHEHGEHCSCGHHHHDHHADEVFQSVGIETAKLFTKSEIKNILSNLSDDKKFGTVLRAKGYVPSFDEWIYFDYIPHSPDVRTGSANVCGRICVIGTDINIDAIKELFGA